MRLNYLSNNNDATINTVMQAIEWEKCDMLLTLNADAQEKQQSIISGKESTLEEIVLAQSKLEKLEQEKTTLESVQESDKKSYEYVLSVVTSVTNEHGTTNDVIALRNVLRLSCCDENSKFFKLAILTDGETFEGFYDAMVSLHDIKSNEIESSGLRNYSNESKKKASELEANIQSLIKKMFSVSVENDLTKKINVKFNKTDMNAIHETFVTGLRVDMVKSKKAETKVDGMSYKYAIEKRKNRQGETYYNGTRFKETLAKIAFTKLFSVKATAEKNKNDKKIEKLMAMTVKNGASEAEAETARKIIEKMQNK